MARQDSTKTSVGATHIWAVSGMDCGSCAGKIAQAVGKLPGVSDLKVSAMTETMSAILDESLAPAPKVEAIVSALGFRATRQSAAEQNETTTQTWFVSGMDCGGCVEKVKVALGKIDGVSDIQVSLMAETLTATRDKRVAEEVIEQRVKQLGYTLRPSAAPDTRAGGSCKTDDVCQTH